VSSSHIVLGLLAVGVRHGYEIKREHDARLPRVRPLAFGQVYSTLARLVRDGFIAEAASEQDGGPERTAYALTERGRAELVSWLSTVEPPAPYVSSVLFAKVVVALMVGDADTARKFLASQRAAHLARMRELTAAKTAAGATAVDVVAADLAIAHLDADLRWMEDTRERVAELRGDLKK
jgi:DNA-binding PadR family transcriptional regulator